jgi:hypothetical protein
MPEKRSLREILVEKVGEEAANKVIERLEALAAVGATGPELEAMVKEELRQRQADQSAALIGIGVRIALRPTAEKAVQVGVTATGAAIGNKISSRRR